jgi:cysteinyl-tRNA synthetase
MKLYSTLTRSLEEFKPIKDRKVKFYHCGPTVYWTQHIGNLRGMTMADLIRRSLLFLGYDVKFVRNYTDVGHLVSDEDEGEDKMEKGARREGLNPKEIADKYITIFEKDCNSLNILTPNYKPRATEYINQIIEMVQILINKGFAYKTDMAVYFDVSKYKEYNRLNRQKIELNEKSMGKGKVKDPQKKHFSDFALWFFKTGAHKNAMQTWNSPWGIGFPGWHIECSAMIKSILGDTIDIHMGGIEHIAIHHTNEIAQSEAANSVSFVHYWLHNEHLIVNEKKMAKSEETGYSLSEIIQHGFDPLDLRYFFLQAHYRSKQNFTWEALEASRNAYQKLKEYMIAFRKQTNRSMLSEEKLHDIDLFRDQFTSAVSNDFQIPQALAITWEVVKSNIPSTDKFDLLLEFDQIFGLKLSEVQEIIIPEEIRELAKQRQTEKEKGNYTAADALRSQISQKGYRILDTKDGYQIKKTI